MEKTRTSFGLRLWQARQKTKLSQKEVCQRVGISQATLSELENDANSSTYIVQLAALYGVDPSYLATGKHSNTKTYDDDRGNTFATKTLSQVPLVSWVKAGDWSDVTDHLADDGKMVETTYRARVRTFALIVDGQSMEPKFPSGCTIIVEPDEQAVNGSYVIVRQNGDKEATFKQLVIEGGVKYLKALNPEWPKRVIEMLPDAVICGVVKRIEMEV